MAYGTALEQRIYYNAPSFLKNVMSSYYGWRQKKDRYGEFYRRYLQYLSESQWYGTEQLEEIQFQKLKEFLVHTSRHCEFYQKLFRQYDFEPAEMRSLSDLSVLPLMDKETVRARLREIIPHNLRRYGVRWVHTSGTTGTGLRFPVSSECFQREYAFRFLHYLWADIREGERFVFCLGHPVTYYDRRKPPFWVYDRANNWLLLSSYHLTEKNLSNYITELEKFQPVLLLGYPSSLYLLARANQRLGQRVHPRAVYTAAETLFDFQRNVIEASFGCKVFMWYGNTEMCGNIVECDRGKLHLKLEHSYVELLGPKNRPVEAGEEGRLVGTGFGNYATPLIRYDVGDMAIESRQRACECGRGGTIIDRVVGRTEDYVLTPDGRLVGRLDHLFKDAIHVKHAQVVQNEIHEVVVRIVKERNYTKKDEDEILREARLRLGSSISIRFDYVDEIGRTSNGKFRFIVSNLKEPLRQSLQYSA
jgi:phenylacetate-CoA ligase